MCVHARDTSNGGILKTNNRTGAFDCVGYGLTKPGVTMYSYRSAADALVSAAASVSTSSAGPPANSAPSTSFNTSLGSFASATGLGSSVAASSLLDVRVATLEASLYQYALAATAGTGYSVFLFAKDIAKLSMAQVD